MSLLINDFPRSLKKSACKTELLCQYDGAVTRYDSAIASAVFRSSTRGHVETMRVLFDSTNAGREQRPFFLVRVCRLVSGERLPLVVGPDGIPLVKPNQWLIFSQRPRLQSNTLKSQADVVADIYDWSRRRTIDLDDRLRTGHGLNIMELNLLYSNLRYTRKFGRFIASEDNADIRRGSVVNSKVHGARIAVARDYLLAGLDDAVMCLAPSDRRVTEIRERMKRVSRQADDYTKLGSDRSALKSGLSETLREKFLEIIRPESRHNPFNKPLRYRNWTILTLLIAYGLRRAEILKLHILDLKLNGREPVLRVVRRPGEKEDPRGIEPAVKTLGRELPLVPPIARILNEFVTHHRPEFPGSEKSPFLFLSSAGFPLSLRGVNEITEQIVKRYAEFDGLLTPHVLRYTFNEDLNRTLQSAGLTSDEIRQARNYLNGWSSQSNQGDLYARQEIEKNAQEISLKHQRALFE